VSRLSLSRLSTRLALSSNSLTRAKREIGAKRDVEIRKPFLWKQSYHDDSPRCFDDGKAQRVISRLKNQAFKIPLKDSRIK